MVLLYYFLNKVIVVEIAAGLSGFRSICCRRSDARVLKGTEGRAFEGMVYNYARVYVIQSMTNAF